VRTHRPSGVYDGSREPAHRGIRCVRVHVHQDGAGRGGPFQTGNDIVDRPGEKHVTARPMVDDGGDLLLGDESHVSNLLDQVRTAALAGEPMGCSSLANARR
jgi:hypothetical protein